MRRSVLRRAALPVAAAIALLTGCTDSAEEELGAAPEETAATTTATATATATAEPTDSGFCAEAVGIEERITGTVVGDPTQLPQRLREVVEEIRAMDPPDDIAQDWAALADGVEAFAASLTDVDPTDPDALATLQERLAPLEQELDAASAQVQDYLAEECGVGAPTGDSAPSS